MSEKMSAAEKLRRLKMQRTQNATEPPNTPPEPEKSPEPEPDTDLSLETITQASQQQPETEPKRPEPEHQETHEEMSESMLMRNARMLDKARSEMRAATAAETPQEFAARFDAWGRSVRR